MSKTVPGSTAGRQVTRFNTGHQFNIRVVEEASSDSFYRNLIEEIQGHFHSHLHDLQLEVLPKEEVILHLYDFLDFINDQKGSYERFSIAYAIYYKEISKQVTDAKERVWNTLYSFYVHLGESSEVRALKFGLEKSKSDDTVHFARQVRSNVAAVLALDLDGLIMDRIWIDTSDFSSLLGAIYDKKAVQKMALLETLKSRCEASQQGIGLSGGEFLAILLFDFVQSRDIVDRSIKRATNRSSKQGSRERKVGSSKDGVKMSLMKQVFGEDPRNQGTQSPGYNQGDQNNYSDDEDEFDTYKPRSSSKNKKKTTKQLSTPNKPIKEQSSKSSAEKSKQLREAMISSYNNKLTELQYLTQEKCKSEDHLVNSIALIRKNAKDYNELLSFSTEVLSAFMDNYYKLKMAQLKEGDGGSRLPIKDSNVEGYKAIGSCAPKVMKKELRNLLDPSALQDNEDCAFPLLSLPHNVDISDKPMFAGYDSKEDFEASKGKAARKMSPSRHK